MAPHRRACTPAPGARRTPAVVRAILLRLDAGTLGATILAAAILLPCTRAHAADAEPAFASRLLSPEPFWHATQGAFRATHHDAGSLLGNAAVLASLESDRIGLSHLDLGEGMSREWAVAAFRVGSAAGAVDAGALHGASLPAFDEDGAPIGSFRPAEWNLGLSAAWPATEAIALGLGARYFRLEDPEEPLAIAAASAGIALRSGRSAFGAAANDVGGRVAGSHGLWAPPTTWILGAAYEGSGAAWTVGAAFVGRPGGSERLSLGLALRPLPWVELLGGYAARATSSADPAAWGCGLSVAPARATIAYAVQSAPAVGLTHQFGLTWNLSRR